MYVDINGYDPLKDASVVVNDPSKVLTTLDTDASIDGLWQRLQQTKITHLDPIRDPYDDNLVKLEKKMQILELQYTILRLKVLGMEGKFTQEEVANIRKMIMSEDEASRTLANSIIENA
jgi:hypothetical protein